MGSKSNSKTSKANKQNVSRANSGKLQSQETQMDKEQNGDPQTDLSVLRKSIDIGVSGVGQAVKVYQAATAEVRQLLAYECDLVYECKVCRNLFRSLANFISHKRVYCREQYSDTKHVFPANNLAEDCTTVILPEPVPPSPCTESWVTNDATPDPAANDSESPSPPHIETSVPRIAPYSKPNKDLSHIIERLSKQRGVKSITETVGHISASKFYETVSEQLSAQRDARKEHVLHLDAIENTKFGVFQTVLQSSTTVQMEDTDLMKTQVVELHNMMSCNEATLGPDGQIAVMNDEDTVFLASAANTDENGVIPVTKQGCAQDIKTGSSKENHVCSICKTRFSTRKTLSHHMKSLHVNFRMCYPCPCCKNTFFNTWSVYRHLYKVHRKTTIQVRKLRSQIMNKAFRKEVSEYESQNSNVKSAVGGAQTEADKARKEQQRLHQENQAWMNNFEDDLELQMCGGCGRRFERRAALNSHSQICQKRIAVQNNIKAARRTPPSTSTANTSNRITSTKILPVSTDRHLQHAENTKNDSTCVESNPSRLTPLSVLSESMQSNASGMKSIVTTSPSPVPLDVSNQLIASPSSASYHRTRHCSGSRADTTKKDVPEKRIEIQIRRDYCKTQSGAGGVSSVSELGGPSYQQEDCNSETDENPMSYDDTGEGSNHDDEVNSLNEDCEGHSGLYQSTEPDPHLSCGNLDGSIGINVFGFTEATESDAIKMDEETVDGAHVNPVPAVRNIDDDGSSIQSLQDIGLNSNTNRSEAYSDATVKKNTDTHISNFMIFSENKSTFVRQASDDRISQDFTNSAALSDSSEVQDEVKKAVDGQGNESAPSANTKKEEQFSPVMENQMQSMINVRRLQCLPCQKKFNKLTNLRRHVAVHIGWNRYRCTECTFKCFSKYDCVAHVNKMHLRKGEDDKAQTMVEYIVPQISNIGTNSGKHEPTEETYRGQNDECGQDIAQVANNLRNKYDSLSEDIEITVNDTSCCKDSDWSLQECDKSKRIITSDSDISIEAIPIDTHNSVMEVEDAEESDSYVCTVKGKRSDDVAIYTSVRQDPQITTYRTTDIAASVEMKREYVCNTVVSDTATTLQAEEASKLTVSTSLRLQPKKCSLTTECFNRENPEAVPSKELLTTTKYQQNIENVTVLDVEENDEHKPEALGMESEISMLRYPVPTSSEGSTIQVENPSVTQVQEQTVLRKMVLEVIFGSGNSNLNHDSEAVQNMFNMAVNGEHDQSERSDSSPEPYDVVECVSSDCASPLTTSSSAESPLTSDDGDSVVIEQTSSVKNESKTNRQNKLQNNMSPVRESEQRQRPVRNRIKVEREDFIYDLSDRCLDPRNDGEFRSSHSSRGTKRKLEDHTHESVKMVLDKGNCSGESSSLKLLPKLTLVRTNVGEYSGVKVVKTGSSSSVTQKFDNSSGKKNNSSNITGYNMSPKKSQRTFDVSPHNVQIINTEESE